ncbi:uncharacterized protein C8Q71DRAFT_904843 [Rhodofomes roseus]|uniref:Uncharacterized protein n=1 Tax=Rhodofomes roseus TaxID=34475 RepID=A0ABQ8KQD5_9APHY|nr:uncharacterized protein C8Q71DRAFT_904843 [Rhodofomes roseus]KAH9840781.1 hypothetical protein C8Q71DRAFT_904843 [Rhodofomes roseus]
MFAPALLSLALAAGAFAVPAALSTRQSPCDGLGPGSSDSLAYEFILTVVDPSTGDGATGPSLALLQGPDSIWWLQETFQSTTEDFSSWNLQNGALIPNPSSNGVGLVGNDFSVPPASIVEFAVTTKGAGNGQAGKTPYCVVTDSEGYATLAVNGNTQGFAMCYTPGDAAYVLVYEPSADNNGAYDFSTCTSQKVQLLKA